MSNTSATGGFLTPYSVTPNQDRDLDLDLQAIVVGITSLCGTLVRRRFQEKPPAQPEVTENWCAIGVVSTTPEAGSPAILHNSTGDGSDLMIRHEVLDVLATFYGPDAGAYAALLRDGLYVSQNREALYQLGMGLIDTEAVLNTSELTNTLYLRKMDLHFRLRRRIERTYAVLNVEEAVGTVHTDGGSTSGPVVTDTPFTVTR